MRTREQRYTAVRDLAEINTLTPKARLRAIRWDVIPWGMVLDIDLLVATKSAYARGWLTFPFAYDVSFPMHEIRAGAGLSLNSELTRVEGRRSPNGTQGYYYRCTLSDPSSTFEINIEAADLFLVYSEAVADEKHPDTLDVRARTTLLSDEVLQDAVRAINPLMFEPGTTA